MTFAGSKIKKTWIKRLPFLRGKARRKSGPSPSVVNISDLVTAFKKNQTVDLKSLLKRGLVNKDNIKSGVKILGRGKIDFPLKINLLCSKKAEEKIIKAGGKIANEKMV